MRFRHPDGSTVHLSYCSNVHPGEDVDGIAGQLEQLAGPVRRALGSDLLGLGLWLPAGAAHELARDPAALRRLRDALAAQRLEVVTLNGFPFGGFHAPVVKRAVYRPDWSSPERLAYTLDLARVLAELLPDDAEVGSISTLPFGWREGWSATATRASLAALDELAAGLEALRDRTGRTVRVGLEPEPGCVVERVDDAASLLAGGDRRWVGVCLDACHLAVQFESPGAAVAALAAVGVPVVKAQVSTALRVVSPRSAPAREALGAFVEPRFLHQTRERGPDGRVAGADDLDEALAGALPGEGEWRVHFHAPVHWSGTSGSGTSGAGSAGLGSSGSGPADAGGGPASGPAAGWLGAAPVGTTQSELRHALDVLVGGPAPLTTHLDVETYTWAVLPPAQRPEGRAGLIDGLARELAWTRDRLTELGLKEVL